MSLRTPRDTWLHTPHRHHHRLRLDGLDAGGRSRPPPLLEQSRQVTARRSRSGVSGGSTPWMTMGVTVVGRMDRIARKAFVPERSGVVIGANVAGDRHVSLGRTRCPWVRRSGGSSSSGQGDPERVVRYEVAGRQPDRAQATRNDWHRSVITLEWRQCEMGQARGQRHDAKEQSRSGDAVPRRESGRLRATVDRPNQVGNPFS